MKYKILLFLFISSMLYLSGCFFEKDVPSKTPVSSGTIIDSSNYMLYLPSGIDKKKKYPLIIALSPSANASEMINLWDKNAEKYKWIIFASKEYKNGGDIVSMLSHIVLILENDIFIGFPVDKSRVISTGFSGGAMGSHGFAFLHPNLIRGIVLNTGMMNEGLADKERYARGKFAVFIASPTDFRYGAMKKDRIFLQNLGWTTKWIEFTGGHNIAPEKTYDEVGKLLNKFFSSGKK